MGGIFRCNQELGVGNRLKWEVKSGGREHKSSLVVLYPDTLVYLIDPEIGEGGRIEREDINHHDFSGLLNKGSLVGKLLRKIPN